MKTPPPLEKTADTAGSDLDDDPREVAQRLGLVAVLPGPCDLFVDVDSDAAMDWLLQMLPSLEDEEGALTVEVVTVVVSKSGLPHRHVYLRASRALSSLERVALQACLGSDRKRELLSLLRVWSGAARPPTVFFELPGFDGPDTVSAYQYHPVR